MLHPVTYTFPGLSTAMECPKSLAFAGPLYVATHISCAVAVKAENRMPSTAHSAIKRDKLVKRQHRALRRGSADCEAGSFISGCKVD